MEFNITGKISLSDYTLFNRYTLRNSMMLPGRLSYWSVMFIVACLVIMNIHTGIIKMRALKWALVDTDLSMIIPTIIYIIKAFPIITLVLLIYTAFRVFVGVLSKKMYYSTEIYSEERRYIVNEKNISVNSKSLGEVSIEKSVAKIAFHKDAVYIYLADASAGAGATRIAMGGPAFIIKDCFFKNLNDFERFKVFVREHYARNKM